MVLLDLEVNDTSQAPSDLLNQVGNPCSIGQSVARALPTPVCNRARKHSHAQAAAREHRMQVPAALSQCGSLSLSCSSLAEAMMGLRAKQGGDLAQRPGRWLCRLCTS